VDCAERVNDLVQEDKRITVTDIADKVDISGGSAYFIMNEELEVSQKLCKVTAKAAYR